MNKLNHVAFIMDGNGRWGKFTHYLTGQTLSKEHCMERACFCSQKKLVLIVSPPLDVVATKGALSSWLNYL